MNWKDEALKLWMAGNNKTEIAKIIQPKYFDELSLENVRKHKVSPYIDNLKNDIELDVKITKENTSFEYKADGSIVSQKFIYLQEGEDLTPQKILEAHGLKPSLWQIVSYKNNYWNTQLKGGTKQISYQSKVTAKPIEQGIDFDEIDEHFKLLDRQYEMPKVHDYKSGSSMAEVNIADLHLGKLCWYGDTGNNFDYKIAKDMYFDIVARIYNELKNKGLEYILFVVGNDFFNSDTITKTTTGGTIQDTDIRWQKLFNIGVEMLVEGIGILKEIAPVKSLYTRSNHDEVTFYHASKYLEAWFRHDKNANIDTDPRERKYNLYGNMLVGYAHGEKATPKKLAGIMPVEAADLWHKSKFREFHTAHLHSEHLIEEINGVLTRRISAPTATDTWHYENGYVGAVRKAQTFIYDKELGLTQIINTPVKEARL